jgi:hypothetical protein
MAGPFRKKLQALVLQLFLFHGDVTLSFAAAGDKLHQDLPR